MGGGSSLLLQASYKGLGYWCPWPWGVGWGWVVPSGRELPHPGTLVCCTEVCNSKRDLLRRGSAHMAASVLSPRPQRGPL